MLAGAIEADVANGLTPRIAWPTLIMAAILAPAHVALLAVGLAPGVSPWWLTLPLGLSAYLHYTPCHEAIHRNIVRTRRFDPVARAMGWWGGALTGMSWPLLLRTHLAHHAHTNGAQDPDVFVQGSLGRLLGLAVVSVFTNLIPVPVWSLIYGEKAPKLGYLDAWRVMSRPEWRANCAFHTLMCASVWTAVLLGHGQAAFALYVLPATIGRLLMGVFLSWLPHRPFEIGNPYRSAALRPGRVLALLSVGHSAHLVHHLWPRVPFYHYHRLWRRAVPIIEARRRRI